MRLYGLRAGALANSLISLQKDSRIRYIMVNINGITAVLRQLGLVRYRNGRRTDEKRIDALSPICRWTHRSLFADASLSWLCGLTLYSLAGRGSTALLVHNAAVGPSHLKPDHLELDCL